MLQLQNHFKFFYSPNCVFFIIILVFIPRKATQLLVHCLIEIQQQNQQKIHYLIQDKNL